ncbi:MAG: hypothetical protein WCQ47_08050 [bacterium]
MNKLILIPTEFEASCIVNNMRRGDFKYLKDGKDKVILSICGIGLTSLKSIDEIRSKEIIQKIIVVGMAGDLTNENRLCNTYIIKTVTNKKEVINLKGHDNEQIKGINHDGYASLITVSKPVYTKTRKQNLANYADLVDMEGFHVAKFCEQNNLELLMIRTVSDNCEGDLDKYFHKHSDQNGLPKELIKAQEIIASIVNKLL